jgi:hypothetical protein
MTVPCACTCCAELLERMRTNRDLNPRSACMCAVYSVDEQCDCAFCASALAEAS